MGGEFESAVAARTPPELRHEHIPLTKGLGAVVEAYDHVSVRLDTPVATDLAVTATLPPPEQWDRFLATLGRHRRARVRLRCTVDATSGGAAAGAHEGVYVAVLAGGRAVGESEGGTA